MNTGFSYQDLLLYYHEAEELLITLLCFFIALRAHAAVHLLADLDQSRRARLFAVGFAILGVSSLIHSFIHAFGLDVNLLYQTQAGYCFGLLLLVTSLAAEKIESKRFLPLAYLPLLFLLLPAINRAFPLFAEFRPMGWIGISYLAGVICMMYVAMYYKRRLRALLPAIAGFFLMSLASALLFFPAAIGSAVWLAGHLLRPFGFLLLFFSITPAHVTTLGGSIMFRALAAFALLAAIPLLAFGSLVVYENVSSVSLISQQLLVFFLLTLTLGTALVFAVGMVIRLIEPLLRLKNTVERIAEEGLLRTITITSNDEIGELSTSFNQMTTRLSRAIEEQERMCRLAATGELAATLAHEIKNPLNAIGGAATYIGKNYEGELVREFVKIITDEVQRINRLTQTLLNFSRPMQPEAQPTDINKLVHETLLLLDQEAKENGITLRADLEKGLPQAMSDLFQIKQVLINLLLNAFEATSAGGLVTVATRSRGRELLLTVQDNGKGIPPEHIREIFNPFFTTKTRGTGLGLAVSKRIAMEHQGDLLVESTPGSGTTFTLILPQSE